jgi:hypothetical protein
VAGVAGTAVMTVVSVHVAPMMGMPIFSGSMVMAGGCLIGHLIYGAIVGAVYGAPSASPRPVHA